MTNLLLAALLCVLLGVAAAVLWPKRHSHEARAFVVVALLAAAAIAVAQRWNQKRTIR